MIATNMYDDGYIEAEEHCAEVEFMLDTDTDSTPVHEGQYTVMAHSADIYIREEVTEQILRDYPEANDVELLYFNVIY